MAVDDGATTGAYDATTAGGDDSSTSATTTTTTSGTTSATTTTSGGETQLSSDQAAARAAAQAALARLQARSGGGSGGSSSHASASLLAPVVPAAVSGNEAAMKAAMFAAALNQKANAMRAKQALMAAGGRTSAELEINDHIQHARWKVTQRETLEEVQERTDCAITNKGMYIQPGKTVPPGERKLYLLIEVSILLVSAK
jgi:ATP-dependent RNA helicase DDX46/PRP5